VSDWIEGAPPRRIPRIVALIAWYDESPLWLAATVTSLAPHIDHLVACDGAYALYPDGKPQSRSDQAAALVEACHAASVGLTLHRPQHVWFGNEIEKRNRMFRLGELETEPDDWYFVLDADCIVEKAPHDLRHQLAATTADNATVSVWERGDPYRNPERIKYESRVAMPADSHFTVRMLFRAVRGLHVEGAHYCYRTPDGRYLWGGGSQMVEDTYDLSSLMQVEHRTHYRAMQRHEDQWTYYKRRNAAGVEVVPA
jgi:hypothetical protein